MGIAAGKGEFSSTSARAKKFAGQIRWNSERVWRFGATPAVMLGAFHAEEVGRLVRETLIGFLAYGLYPAWLVAGGADYLCHRRTRIEETSGTEESWFHVAQLATIVAIIVLAAFFEITRLVLVLMFLAAALHTVLSYLDVRYTEKRRYISPFEQHVHAFLDVLPIIAVALLAILFWSDASTWELSLKAPAMAPVQRWLLSGSVLVLAGVPVVEELVRTYRRKDNASIPDR